MKKQFIRMLSLLLCLSMVLGMVPEAFAAETVETTVGTEAQTEPVTEGTEAPCDHVWDEGVGSETVITYTCILCGETRDEDIVPEETTEPAETTEPEKSTGETEPATEETVVEETEEVFDAVALGMVASGVWGVNLRWTLTDDGVLTISGSGGIPDPISFHDRPWELYRDEVKTVELDGVSEIGMTAFLDCASLNRITIPDTVTSIAYGAFYNCTSLTSITLPKSLSSLGRGGNGNIFLGCSKLSEIIVDPNNSYYSDVDGVLFNKDRTKLIQYPTGRAGAYAVPAGVTTVGEYAFEGCSSLTDVTISESVTNVGNNAFFDSTITSINIPSGVTSIGNGTFSRCFLLASITLPESITYIDNFAFLLCGLKDVYYSGTEEERAKITIGGGNEDLTDATWHYEPKRNGLAVYSDCTGLAVCTGSVITLAAGILENGERIENISGITFQVEDPSVLKLIKTGTVDNCRYLELRGIKEGTSSVIFNDSSTGQSKSILVTVSDRDNQTFTLKTVPKRYFEGFPTNFYNFNGIYVDNYSYSLNADQSAKVSFDVYNTNYVYGAVEVYYEDGSMYDAVLFKKRKSNKSSIKEALFDNIACLVHDMQNDAFMTYRQESGFSVKTSVSVKVPKGGYIKITLDPNQSFITSAINGADILMGLASLQGKIQKYDVNGPQFTEDFKLELVKNSAYAHLVKDGSKMAAKLWKNMAKKIFLNPKSLGDFTENIARNLDAVSLAGIFGKTAYSYGCSLGESVFTYFAGPCGEALKTIFLIGKLEDFVIQCSDAAQLADSGFICIQNQGGGKLSVQQIQVEGEKEFSEDVALNVYEVTLGSELFDKLKEVSPELYEKLSSLNTRTYNISLLKNRKETQPDGKVTVYIPIPEDMKLLAYAGQLRIYRVEPDGTATEMDVKIINDCLVFTTDHFSLYAISGGAVAYSVSINSRNFPDQTFRNYVSVNFDSDGDGYLSEEEIQKVTRISVDGQLIASLKGVKYFTELSILSCEENQLKELDVSQNLQLELLRCTGNQLTTLDVSRNTELTDLLCSGNQLTELDVSNSLRLFQLNCSGNQLTTLDIGEKTSLRLLACSDNKLAALDISRNPTLMTLHCQRNQLTKLDVSQVSELLYLYCEYNQIEELDLTHNLKLRQINCRGNRLISLDVGKNTQLVDFRCSDNSRDISVSQKRKFDLSTLSGFDVSKASGWVNGSVNGTILTVDEPENGGIVTVRYTYDCGNNYSSEFNISVLTASTSAPIYRLYNPYTLEHLFVSSESEYELLGSVSWVQEGVAWKAPVEGAPVYRLYNPYADGHFYTVSEAERDKCISDGWLYDGVVSYDANSDEGVPIFRMFNPFEEKNYHHYTVDEKERDHLVTLGWLFEGIAWYAAK